MTTVLGFGLAACIACIAYLVRNNLRLRAELAKARREADAWQTAWRADAENRMLARLYRKRMAEEDELARKINQLMEQEQEVCSCGHTLAEHADDGISEGCFRCSCQWFKQ